MIARHSFPLKNANQPGERFPLGHDVVGDGLEVCRDEEVAIGKRPVAGSPSVDCERRMGLQGPGGTWPRKRLAAERSDIEVGGVVVVP